VVLVITAIPASVVLFRGVSPYAITPSQEAAAAAVQAWHKAFQQPVKLVSGTERYSLALTFYTPDRPAEFTHFQVSHAPWVTPERIANEGLLVVCEQQDLGCLASATQYETPRTVRRQAEFRTRLWGMDGPVRGVEFVLIPPK
jgi:hypothetical protein